jgi:hypothetical protein
MKRRLRGFLPLPALVVSVAAALSCGRRQVAQNLPPRPTVRRPPHLRPDYAGTVIPPNLAPLNFVVEEPGTRFAVAVRGPNGRSVRVVSATPSIFFPQGPWRSLLSASRGRQLTFEVCARSAKGGWRRFQPVTTTVAREEVDPYLVSRVIPTVHNIWFRIEIRQRNLENFDQSPILHNRSFADGCLNCHAFCNNRTDLMTVGIRSKVHGSSALLAKDGSVTKIDAKFGYTAWHPSGRVAAFSLNKVNQFFHAGGVEVRDVVDNESALAYYVVAAKTVRTSPKFSNPDRLETYPTWSPDGRYLYFCSAPVLWQNRRKIPPDHYEELQYDLMRIPYDIERDDWGERETVLSAKETGRSLLLPRISPDGRFLLFCGCDYGCFPIYQPSSDLYLLDLRTRKYRRLDLVNSDRSESWHSWSSNSRWFVFSSKRRDGLFTRSYFSYVDERGNAHKPFLLPQEDPTFYDTCLNCYNVPELITGPVRTTPRRLAAAIRGSRAIKVDMPVKFSTAKGAKAGAAPTDMPWRSGR